MLTVVTGWSPSGWKEYAYRFAHTFAMYWPAEVRCIAYVEERDTAPDRIEQRLLSEIPGCMEFIEKYRNDPLANGRQPTARWKDKERAKGYSYKWDAWKFSRQGYVPYAAAQHAATEFLAWFDADVVFSSPVRVDSIVSLLPDGEAVAYLGRPQKHSEIGFQLYRLPDSTPHLRAFRDFYDSGEVFRLDEWHSAYVFDRSLERSGVKSHNITPHGSGNVWLQSPLARFSVHLKGNRKYEVRGR